MIEKLCKDTGLTHHFTNGRHFIYDGDGEVLINATNEGIIEAFLYGYFKGLTAKQ